MADFDPTNVANPLVTAMTTSGQPASLAAPTSSAVPSTLVPPEATVPLPTTPSQGQNLLSGPTPAPGSFGQKMAQAAQKLGILPGPGGALKSIAASAIDALSGVTSGIQRNLGDVATGPVTPGGSGILEGVTQTLANRNQRLTAEADRAAKQKQQSVENMRQDQIAAASIAHENAATVHEQALVSKMGFDTAQQMVANQKGAYDSFVNQGAPVIAKDLSESEAKTMLAQGKLDPSSQHVFPTGVKETGKDANGQPVYDTTYSVVGDIPEYVFDKTTADYVNKTHPGINIKEGQPMAGYQAGQLIQQSNTAAAATMARNQFLDANASHEQAEAIRQEKVDLGPEWNAALARNGVNRPDLAARSLMQDPNYLKKYPNFMNDVIDLYGGRETWDAAMKNVSEQAIAAQKEKNASINKMDFTGDLTKTGQAYLDSLSPQEKSVVQSVGTGHETVNNFGYLLSRNPGLGAALARAYPTTFDESKAASYGGMYKDYISGNTSKALVAAGTALADLQDLHDINKDMSAFVYGTDAYRRRQQIIDQVAPEVARFNLGGTSAPDKEAVEEMRKSLGQAIPFNSDSAIFQAASHMQNRINEYNNHWKEGQPSKYYEAPMPSISPEALASANYLTNNGKYIVNTSKGILTTTDKGKAEAFYRAMLKNQPTNIEAENPQEAE
jgi:hypothetical protein